MEINFRYRVNYFADIEPIRYRAVVCEWDLHFSWLKKGNDLLMLYYLALIYKHSF